MTELSSLDWARATPGNPALHSRRMLRCRSIEAAFLQALDGPSFSGRVHSVFHRVVNIECDSGKLFTLAGSGLDNAPNTAIVHIADFDNCGMAANDPVLAVKDGLRIGDDTVMNWTSASTWQAILPRYTCADGDLQFRLDWAQSYLAHNGAQGSFVNPNPVGNAFARQTCIALQQRSGALLEALEQMQMALAHQHAESMIGLGPGLTPSGDDFLVGLFAVLNLRGSPCHGWLGGGKDVLLHATHSTNAISLAALTAAASGHVRQSIAQFVEALMCGTSEALTKSLDCVLAIGSTSGSDMVVGILAGLRLNLRVETIESSHPRSHEPVAADTHPSMRGAPLAAIKSTGG